MRTVQLAGSGVSLSIAFPGMTQSSMLNAMDARTRALINELPSVNVYPARQVKHTLSTLLLCHLCCACRSEKAIPIMERHRWQHLYILHPAHCRFLFCVLNSN